VNDLNTGELAKQKTSVGCFMTERWVVVVRGIVQGVGFRPYVYNLARRVGLGGRVRNQTGDVSIEIEGDPAALNQFLAELIRDPPPLARIENVSCRTCEPLGEQQFHIVPSDTQTIGKVYILADIATCDACVTELFDPSDRRYRYPFLNCTNCGPRLTVITGLPYDRERTTLAGFPMCPACRAEYEDPANRRFHAEPTACPACGPRLQLHDSEGQPLEEPDPLIRFTEAIRGGSIGALKGLGGYHLVCDATNEAAVKELRRRKHRDEKPFALMVMDVAAAEAVCVVSPLEQLLLGSSDRPIVLLQRRPTNRIVESVAPGNPYLGLMLPYTPLHHMLMREVDGRPLVMTSGNRSDEPIAHEDDDAFKRLARIADLFLTHNRPIHVRCDDSVTRLVGGVELPIRRSRGYAPKPIALPLSCPCPILAVGGQLKGTFALGQDRHAFLSQHLGDLDHYQAYQAFERDIELYEQLFAIRPALLAHDRHPDYASTRYAQDRAAREGINRLAVQHHHAHMASCMAEHGLTGPVIGVVFDGTGYGTDGAIWGGEFLTGGYHEFQRAAHLRYVKMPGGELAIREPWRIALAHLVDAGWKEPPSRFAIPATILKTVRAMLDQGINAPQTSSIGRLFDAAAALAGVRNRVSYEGQAAVELEWLAMSVSPDGSYPFDLAGEESGSGIVIDTRPLIVTLAQEARDGVAAAVMARRFHTTVVELIATTCDRIRAETQLSEVVLSGGVFMNALLTCEVTERLSDAGFTVYRHRQVPPNDGGLSLGQLAVAACHVEDE
jgi:hydrogenase maturation protein HypF